MKAIMMSIKPEYVAKILNGEKTLEIRKKFPSDYVGWVYIYCTKSVKKDWHLLEMIDFNNNAKTFYTYLKYKSQGETFHSYCLDGKVVARFWCDKVEEITTREDRFKEFIFYETSLDMEDLCKQSCLDYNELDDYLYGENGKAIHITQLEIFDKPKELKEFYWYREQWVDCGMDCPPYVDEVKHYLTKAPQSFVYVEV